jgi:hypothetical protein
MFLVDPDGDFSHLEPSNNEEEDLEDDEADGDDDEEDYDWLDNKSTFNSNSRILFDKRKRIKDGQETTLRWWKSVVTKAPEDSFDGFGVTTGPPLKNLEDLPMFMIHPVDSFIIRGKPAVFECTVLGAEKVRSRLFKYLLIVLNHILFT